MPRFVVLEHDHPELHWDFMLECGNVLRTWRLAAFPQEGQNVAATAAFDHRLVYLDYEGSVGGNRGQVKRSDAGNFRWVTPEAVGEVDQVIVILEGERLRGRVVLQKAGGKWSFTLHGPCPA